MWSRVVAYSATLSTASSGSLPTGQHGCAATHPVCLIFAQANTQIHRIVCSVLWHLRQVNVQVVSEMVGLAGDLPFAVLYAIACITVWRKSIIEVRISTPSALNCVLADLLRNASLRLTPLQPLERNFLLQNGRRL